MNCYNHSEKNWDKNLEEMEKNWDEIDYDTQCEAILEMWEDDHLRTKQLLKIYMEDQIWM